MTCGLPIKSVPLKFFDLDYNKKIHLYMTQYSHTHVTETTVLKKNSAFLLVRVYALKFSTAFYFNYLKYWSF